MTPMAIRNTPHSSVIVPFVASGEGLPAAVSQALARLHQSTRAGPSNNGFDVPEQASAALTTLLAAAQAAPRPVQAAILARTAQALLQASPEHSGGVISDAHARQLLHLANQASKSYLRHANASKSSDGRHQQTATHLTELWRTLTLSRWNTDITHRAVTLARQVQQAAGTSMSMDPIAELTEEEDAPAVGRASLAVGGQASRAAANPGSPRPDVAVPSQAFASSSQDPTPRLRPPPSSTSSASSTSAMYMRTRRQRAAPATRLVASAAPKIPKVPGTVLQGSRTIGKHKTFTRAEQAEAGMRKYPFALLEGNNETWLKSTAIFFGSYGKVSMGRPLGQANGQKVGIKALRTRDDPHRNPDKPEKTRRSGEELARTEIAETTAIREAIERGVPRLEAELWPDANPLEAVRTGKQPSIVFDSIQDPNSKTFYMVSTLELGSVDSLVGSAPIRVIEDLGASLSAQVFVELAAMHKEADKLHLDLKPDNIQYNGFGQAKLADFGLAQRMDARGNSAIRGLYGTLVAPEMILDVGPRPTPLSRATDVHALSASMLNMAAGLVASPFAKKIVFPPLREQQQFDPERVEVLQSALKQAQYIGTQGMSVQQLRWLMDAFERAEAAGKALMAPAGRPEFQAAFYDEKVVESAIAAAQDIYAIQLASNSPPHSREFARQLVAASKRLRAPMRTPRRFDYRGMQEQAAAVQRVLVALQTPSGLKLPRQGRWVDAATFPKSGNVVVDQWFEKLCRRAPELAEALLPGLLDGRGEGPPRATARELAQRLAALVPSEGSVGQRNLRDFFAYREQAGVYHDVFHDADNFENNLLNK